MKIINSGSVVNFNGMKADKLVEYIINTHHSYIKDALSTFNVHSKTIVKIDSALYPEVIAIYQLSQELKELLEQHLSFEEYILYPYIKKLIENSEESSDNLLENPINKIREENTNISNIFKKLRILSGNYVASVNSSPALKLCYAQLFDLEQDVNKHAFLEENILFSKLNELEKRKTNSKK
ncbi:MAG: hemerythrin domain-containing protein [Bacteroidetes bacterium]|nr:hemerythrin domain-containing protein [Bacteroidota bacterium]